MQKIIQKTKILGNDGEALIVEWLQKHGATILARNFQTRLGEIDIVATKGDVVVFVEVKTRVKEYFSLDQTVTYSKQQRIIKTARQFILEHQLRDRVFRFDIATIIWEAENYKISYIKNAFGPN